MPPNRRQSRIRDYLGKCGYAPLVELAAALGVSISTARRDVDAMHRTGSLRRTRGGAVLLEAPEHPLDYGLRALQHAAEKEAIGEIAAGFIREGDTVILDGGTTTFQVAKRLRDRAVQVVTNSLPIANVLGTSSRTEVVFLGGCIMPRTGVALGPFAEGMLKCLHARLAILGTAGVAEDGLFNAHLLMVEVERLMMTAAEEVTIVVDSSKFGRRSLARLCGLQEIDRVVTDSAAEPHWLEALAASGVEVHIATPAQEDQQGSGAAA